MGFNNIVQLGVVCRAEDFEDTVRYWQESAGSGPCWVIEADPEKQTWYGEPTAAKFRAGFTYVGDMQIEVMSPTNDAMSSATAALAKTPDPPRGGIAHHIQLETPEYDKSLAELVAGGSTVAWTAEFRGRRIAHLESEGTFGFPYVELTPPKTPEAEVLIAEMKRQSSEWDRATAPTRSYVELLDQMTAFVGKD